MTITDAIVITLLLLLTAKGAYQGFLRSLITPLAIILSLIPGLLYFFGMGNFKLSLLIAVIGPFLISRLILFILRILTGTDQAPEPGLLSRMAGQAVSFVWGAIVLLFVIAVLSLFPFERFELGGITREVLRSKTFQIIEPTLIRHGVNPRGNKDCSGSCDAREKAAEKLASDKDIAQMIADPRVQKLISDPVIQAAINRQDMAALLSNPAIRELAADPHFLIKALKAYPKIRSQMSQ